MPDRTELVVAYAETDVEIAQRLQARFAEAGFRPVLAGFPDHDARWALPRAATAVCLFSQETAGRVAGWTGDAAVVLALVDVDEPPAGWQDAGAVVRRWDWAGGTFSRVVSVLDRTRLRGVLDVLLGSAWPAEDDDPSPDASTASGDTGDTALPLASPPPDASASQPEGPPPASDAEAAIPSAAPDAAPSSPADTRQTAPLATPAAAPAGDAAPRPTTRGEIADALAALLTAPDATPPRMVAVHGSGGGALREAVMARLLATKTPRLHVVGVDAGALPPGVRAADHLLRTLLRTAADASPGVRDALPHRVDTGDRSAALRRMIFIVLLLAGAAYGVVTAGWLTWGMAAAVLALAALLLTGALLGGGRRVPDFAVPPEERDALVGRFLATLEDGRGRLVVLAEGVHACPRDEAAELVRAIRWLSRTGPASALVALGDAGRATVRAATADDALTLWLPPLSPAEMETALGDAMRPRPASPDSTAISDAVCDAVELDDTDADALRAVLPHLPPTSRDAERFAAAYRLTRALLAARGDGIVADAPAIARWVALALRWPAVAASLAASSANLDLLATATAAAGSEGDAVRALLEPAALSPASVAVLARVTLHADLRPESHVRRSRGHPASPSRMAQPEADAGETPRPPRRRPARRLSAPAPSAAEETPPARPPRRTRKPTAAEPPAVEAEPAASPAVAEAAPEVFVDPNQLGLF
jgi:hypothetical protein